MGGNGNKKNKRGSIPSSTSSVIPLRTELFERTPENDYGVLSDPDENTAPLTAIIPENDEIPTHAEKAHEQEPSLIIPATTTTTTQESPILSAVDEGRNTPPEQPLQSSSLQPSQSSSQSSSPSLQAQISQPPTSLDALQLKLSRDKNFSKKITLHTFFSYIILAIEIKRASSTSSDSASVAQLSIPEVQKLIEYMIQHHTEKDEVREYLQTLMNTGVIQNLIEAIIDFNKDQTDALDKLLTAEEIELEMAYSIQESAAALSSSSSASASSSSSQTSQQQPQSNTPRPQQQRGFFKRLISSLCCGGCR